MGNGDGKIRAEKVVYAQRMRRFDNATQQSPPPPLSPASLCMSKPRAIIHLGTEVLMSAGRRRPVERKNIRSSRARNVVSTEPSMYWKNRFRPNPYARAVSVIYYSARLLCEYFVKITGDTSPVLFLSLPLYPPPPSPRPCMSCTVNCTFDIENG